MTEHKSLYVRLAAVLAAVERIPKRGYNEFHKYEYALAADVIDSMRTLFVEHGLILLAQCAAVEREVFSGEKGDSLLTRASVVFTVADPESGESINLPWVGEGYDKGDKGLYKAYTGALKYWLMDTFLIPTGDDPENDPETDKRAESHRKTAPRSRQQPESRGRQGTDKPTVRDPEAVATDPQKKKVWAMWNQLCEQVTDGPTATEDVQESLNAYAAKVLNIMRMSTLTKGQASSLIDVLDKESDAVMAFIESWAASGVKA
jgi:hypothetical protein